MPRLHLTSIAALLALTGCQLIVDFDRNRISMLDAGADAGGLDSGGADAGTDSGIDGSAEAGIDDGGIDDGGMGDGGTDGGVDDGGMPDTGLDSAMPDGGSDSGTRDAGDSGTRDSGPRMICGNSAIEGTEACDDGNTMTEMACPYGMATCMRCNAGCSMSLSLMGPTCGDEMRNGPEDCDGADLGGASCTTVGAFTGGTLMCSGACTYDTSGCTM